MRENRQLALTWYGHSAFFIEDGDGRSVLIDPWIDNPKSPVRPSDVPAADLLLVTHGHGDHVGNVVEIAKRTGAPVLAIHEVSLYLCSRGLANVVGMNKGGTVERGGVRVTMTHAVHSSDIDADGAGKLQPGGEAAGFVIDFPGYGRVYHAGDTDVFGDMKLIRELHSPDIAILPIGGLYTMGPKEAAMAVRLLEPRHVVGMHYGTFPPLTGTPAELRTHLKGTSGAVVAELVPGTPARFS